MSSKAIDQELGGDADRTSPAARGAGARAVSRIAIGVDGRPESRDAVALGTSLAAVTQAEVLLVGVRPEPLVVLPEEMNWTSLHRQTAELLADTCDAYAPGARVTVEPGPSVPRALERVVTREDCDLLVVGSSRHAVEGRVRIGTRTRQLLSELTCALAIAPRGMHRHQNYGLRRIGVGYDGHDESAAAVTLAGSLALAAEAELFLCGVVDDRDPSLGWGEMTPAGAMMGRWEERIVAEMDALRDFGLSAASATGATAHAEILRGRPADPLIKLSEHVDLLVIGSRRWGAMARVLQGSTGEALAHHAACPLLVVPRPSA
jgi:nucleotide-binding universal stress UspA family protein